MIRCRRAAGFPVAAVVVGALLTSCGVSSPPAAAPPLRGQPAASGPPAAAGRPVPAGQAAPAGRPAAAGASASVGPPVPGARTPARVKRAARKPSRTAAAAEATKLLARSPAVVRGGDGERYTVRDVVLDEDGGRHVRIGRTYRGLAVLGGDAVLHIGADGHSDGATVAQDRRIDVGVTPAVTSRRAEATAVAAYPGTRRGGPARLVVDAVAGRPVLAWEVRLLSGELDGYDVVVDAGTGAVRRGVELVRGAEAGRGRGLHSGDVPLSTRPGADGGYELVDPDRGDSETRDALNETRPDVADTALFTDADNVWGDGTMTDRATAAADVHYAVQQSWDFFKTRFGRNGVADDGRGVVALVHHERRKANASWSDRCRCMSFGDGNGSTKAFTALDIVGHEMTHGITSATAGLVYWNESGGLDEASSDIFGTLIEFAAQNPADPADYLIGEQVDVGGVDGAPLRYMDDPARDGRSRSCWTPDVGGADVHHSSGVANKFFFMLAEGSGTSRYGTSPTCGGAPAVTGIGRDEAGAIWYHALTRYLVSNSNFASARLATLRAAAELHGAGSAQHAAVEAAWNAVGVDQAQRLPQAPAVRDPGSLTGVVGQAVRLQIEASDAQGEDLTFTATDLPDGLTISADGLVTGVPTRGDLYVTQFTVTDSAGNATTWPELWDVSGPPTFDPETVRPRTTTVGESVFDYVEAIDRDLPLTWRITGLPDGLLHEDPADSWIAGVPTAAGVWNITATVTDADGMSASVTFPWTIEG